MVCGHETTLKDQHEVVRRGLVEACAGPPGDPIVARIRLIAEWPK
jgi:hypothetical protein